MPITERDNKVTVCHEQGQVTVDLPDMDAGTKATLLQSMAQVPEKYEDLERFCATHGLRMHSPTYGPQIMMAHNIVGEDGQTFRDRQLKEEHAIPIGTLVEVKLKEDKGCSRSVTYAQMFVVGTTRDCDGTPLYSLSMTHPLFMDPPEHVGLSHTVGGGSALFHSLLYNIQHGYSEESLKIVEHPLYDPSFLAQLFECMLVKEYGEDNPYRCQYQHDYPRDRLPGTRPKASYVLLRDPEATREPDFETMRANRLCLFQGGEQPYPGTILEVVTPNELHLHLDRQSGIWATRKDWRKKGPSSPEKPLSKKPLSVFTRKGNSETCAACGKHVARHYGLSDYRCQPCPCDCHPEKKGACAQCQEHHLPATAQKNP